MGRYLQRPVGRPELRSLVALARAEERAFFERNPHLVRVYRDRLLLVALCQGAALQYLRHRYGVKDFDVHFFYAQNPAKPRLSRAVKRVHATVGAFEAVPVDFIRTVIRPRPSKAKQSVADRVRSFLHERPTANAIHLSRKAVIGLLPDGLFGHVLWRPAAAVALARTNPPTVRR